MEALSPHPKLWTIEEYERLGELGVFDQGPRVELIEGEIIEMSPQNRPHSHKIMVLTHLLVGHFGPDYYTRVQLPFNSGRDSQPEPDFCILRKEQANRAPGQPEEAELVIEISDSSLSHDRRKAALYARAGVPEYWIVNLRQQRVEVHREPSRQDGLYKLTRIYGPGESIQPLATPDRAISVDLLVVSDD